MWYKNRILLLGLIYILVCFTNVSGQNKKLNKSRKPDYKTVFPGNKVNRIEIKFISSDWDSIQSQLTRKFGKPGERFMPGPPPEMENDSNFKFPHHGMFPPPEGDSMRRMPPPMFGNKRPPFPGGKFGGPMGPGKPGGMGMPFDTINEKTVPCEITFNGKTWNNGAFHFKGNSSLMMSYSQQIKKLPFRLKFRKNTYDSASFFGFRDISFTNNINDLTYMREKLAGLLFRKSGIKAAHSAFYEVYIDNGSGLQYFGLYSAIEIIEDTMLKDQFGTKKGNCYKPAMPAGSFASNIFDSISIVKKNNKKNADWTDVKKLHALLHSGLRKTNPIQWKKQLEKVFDVPVFLKWLAINTVIQNWDTYGIMAHNYYLYHNPKTNKLTWIPWDNNEAFNANRMGKTTFEFNETDDNWPLIRYILDVPKYKKQYVAEIKAFIAKEFNPEILKMKIAKYQSIIEASVQKEEAGYTFKLSEKDFENAIIELKKHIANRYNEAQSFISKN